MLQLTRLGAAVEASLKPMREQRKEGAEGGGNLRIGGRAAAASIRGPLLYRPRTCFEIGQVEYANVECLWIVARRTIKDGERCHWKAAGPVLIFETFAIEAAGTAGQALVHLAKLSQARWREGVRATAKSKEQHRQSRSLRCLGELPPRV